MNLLKVLVKKDSERERPERKRVMVVGGGVEYSVKKSY